MAENEKGEGEIIAAPTAERGTEQSSNLAAGKYQKCILPSLLHPGEENLSPKSLQEGRREVTFLL